MSDLPPPPPAAPPPPPPPSPPPAFQPPPGYAPSATPSQVPPPYLPTAAAGTGLALGAQFTGDAMWSIGLGLAAAILPFLIHNVFFFLPLIGLVYGVRAIMR